MTPIVATVQRLIYGAVRLWPSTLYGSLDDCAERKWIEELCPSTPEEKARVVATTAQRTDGPS